MDLKGRLTCSKSLVSHQVISMDNIQLVWDIFREKPKNKTMRASSPKWTISYQCGGKGPLGFPTI